MIDIDSLARKLFERRAEGVFVRHANVRMGPWKPAPQYCHENVTKWTNYCTSHKPVRGWMLNDLSIVGFARFTPHSVIEIEDGTLRDITPPVPSRPDLFIRHHGSEEAFAQLASGLMLGSL